MSDSYIDEIEQIRAFLRAPFWNSVLRPTIIRRHQECMTSLRNRSAKRAGVTPDDELWGWIKALEWIEAHLRERISSHDDMLAEQAERESEEAAVAPLVAGGRHGPFGRVVR